MINHKNIESALIEVIKVTYSQGTKKYDKLGALYRKRDPEDHIRYVAKQHTPNEKTYNERMADFKDWYNEEIYTSLEKLYKLYLEISNQEEKVEKRTKLQVDEIFQKIH
ncbi:8135_t:CDS:2, partial [Racocetra fulgida]